MYTIEQRMLDAHQDGIEHYHGAPYMLMVTLQRHARRLFSYTEERDAFAAGYLGEKKRIAAKRHIGL